MAGFLMVAKDDGIGHYHIAYIAEDGFGITSLSDGHSHTIEPANIQLQEGIPPTAIPSVVVGVNGHSHELEEYQTNPPTLDEDWEELAKDVMLDYSEAKEYELESIERGEESEKMYCGEQWEKEDIDSIPEGRASLVIDRLEEKIDNLSGYQRQNRTEIKYLPTENGDNAVADVLNIIVKNALDNCYYQREKTKVFEDQAIVGRGIFHIYEDYERNIEGTIIVERFPWDEVLFFPHEKEDLSDCDGVIKTKWFSESKIKEMYPDEFKNISPSSKDYLGVSKTKDEWHTVGNIEEFIDKNAHKYRVIERIKKVYERPYIIVNPVDGFVYNAQGWNKKDIMSIKSIPGFTVVPRVTYNMRMTVMVGGKVVDDGFIEEMDFDVIPVYAHRRRGKWWGKIEKVKDLQRLINKTYSQFVDIISKVVNYGYFYDSQTFPNKRAKDRFLKNASIPGFTQEITDVGRPPLKEEGVRFPTEIVNAIALFNQNMREILNINLDMLGFSNSERSGTAMRQKIAQQLLGNDYMFDNLSFAEKILGKIILSKIKKIYSTERIIRIIGKEMNNNPELTIGGQPVTDVNVEAIARILRDINISDYDVVVGESSASPSAMMGNFLMLMELAGKGVPIPPEAIITFAPTPNKDKILQALEASHAQQQASEEMKYKTEIAKTLIAKKGGQPDSQQQGGVMV